MDEFSIIAKYFKPLSANCSGSFNLSDDAALLTPPQGHELVITKDVITQGVHFIGNESPELIATKALRVNLSDLAAMGAEPLCYFLALMLPKNTSKEWLEKFTEGLKQTQDKFNISLAGGDTTSTEGNLSVSITAIGSVPTGKVLKRSSAKAGDDIYVSGTLGDSALGLELLHHSSTLPPPLRGRDGVGGELDFSTPPPTPLPHGEGENIYLINRYLIPQPRLELGVALRNIANSAMDISDGLAQDLEHICTASSVSAVIYAERIPTTNNQQPITTLTGGDDYELLFTAPPDQKNTIEELSKKLSLPLTRIGTITKGNNIQILDKNGNEIALSKKGFMHF